MKKLSNLNLVVVVAAAIEIAAFLVLIYCLGWNVAKVPKDQTSSTLLQNDSTCFALTIYHEFTVRTFNGKGCIERPTPTSWRFVNHRGSTVLIEAKDMVVVVERFAPGPDFSLHNIFAHPVAVSREHKHTTRSSPARGRRTSAQQ